MDQRPIEYFVAVAETAHFRRAAQRLGVAQSTVSAGVRALERELGTSLFERSTRAVRLTPAGDAFLPEAKAALELFDRARATVEGTGSGVRGPLVVGTLSGLSLVDGPSLVRAFRERHPEVRLSVVTSPAGTRGLLEQLRSHQMDIAFVGIPDLLSLAGVHARPLAQLPLDVLVPEDHRLAERASVRLAELAEEPFIDLPLGFGARTLVDAAFHRAGVPRRVAIEVADMTKMPEWVAGGAGIAITSPVASADDLPVRMVRLVRPRLSWTLYVATPERGAPTRAAAAFLDLVPDHVRDRGRF